jgi:hypothetical protein
MKYHLKHTIRIPADQYYKVITSPKYDDWSRERLKLESRTVLEESDTPERLHRRVRMVTGPVSERTRSWIKKDKVVVVEDFSVDKRSGTFTWRFEPDVFRDKVKTVGTGRIIPSGPDSCVRDMEIELKISVPILGGIIERAIDKKVDEYFRKVNTALEDFYFTVWKPMQGA